MLEPRCHLQILSVQLDKEVVVQDAFILFKFRNVKRTCRLSKSSSRLSYLSLVQHDIRARLLLCRAVSLVDVRDAAFKGVADRSLAELPRR